MANSIKRKNINPNSSALKNFLAGGVGGIALVSAGQPVDTIKVYHTQTQACMHEI
jgi:hypothetical protein